jgi:hypothetical protein
MALFLQHEPAKRIGCLLEESAAERIRLSFSGDEIRQTSSDELLL